MSISPNNEKEESTKQLKEDVQKTDSTPIASSAPAEENSEKKNTCCHRNNRSNGKHEISLDVLDTLLQSIPDGTRPHNILPLSRR